MGGSAGTTGGSTGGAGRGGTGGGGGTTDSGFDVCGAMGIASVRGLAYLPDGSGVIAGLAGGAAKLIAPSDAHEVRNFIGHAGGVNGVAVSADGATLATASDDRTVRLWRISDGAALMTLPAGGRQLLSVALSADGARVAAGAADGQVFLWNRTTGAPIGVASDHVDEVRGMAFAANSTRLYTGSKDGSARVYAAADLTPLATPMQGGTWINAVVASPDGAHVAIGDLSSISFWRASDAGLERRIQAGGVNNLSYASNGTRVFASTGCCNVAVYPVDGSASTPLLSPIGGTPRVAASPLGGALFVATDWHLWLTDETGAPLRDEVTQGPFAHDVAFTPDGSRVAIGGDFGLIVRSVASGAVVASPAWGYAAGLYNGVAFSPDGSLLATGDDNGSVKLWPTSTWQSPREVYKASIRAMSVAFSPDGTLLAAAGASGLDDVYRVSTGAYVNFLGYSDYMRSIAFSPDGTLIATGGDDVSHLGIARVSDWSDVRRVDSAHLPVADIAFSPNNQIVATTGDTRITVWQVTGTAARRDLYQGPTTYQGNTVAIPADGAVLLAGGSDGLIRQWSLPALTALPSLPGHGTGIVKARFSADGRRLAAASADGTVWIWCRR
jgi:WD40 repeat protein